MSLLVERVLYHYIWLLSEFISWLNSLVFANGVSMMGFIAALFIICLLLNNFLLRGH